MIIGMVKQQDGTRGILRCQTSGPRECYLLQPITAANWQLKDPLPDVIAEDSGVVPYENGLLIVGGYFQANTYYSPDIFFYHPELEGWLDLSFSLQYDRRYVRAFRVSDSFATCG